MTDDGELFDRELWDGMDFGEEPMDMEPAEEVAAQAVAAGESIDQMRMAHLPDEFWGARDLFKQIWWAAKAEGTMPDAVLGVALARASAMVSHELTFNSGKPGNLNMFVNIVSPSGIGKSEAMRGGKQVLAFPPYLTDRNGEVDRDRYRESGLGSGEGIAEAFMGVRDVDTGEFYRSGPNKGEPRQKSVRCQIRHNAFLHLDEGETLTRMMERKGSTIGTVLRSAWVGAQLGQANAQELTTRDVAEKSYALGIVIGFQPFAAQQMLTEASGGTPQRFLWLSALDANMADGPSEPPAAVELPLAEPSGFPRRGIVAFPSEIKQALWDNLSYKTKHPEEIDEMNSHEPLMRCKLAALLCVLDGRMEVSRDDWRLAGMVWAVSCAVRDRLIQYGKQKQERDREAEKHRHAELAAAGEAARIEVSERVAGYARTLAERVRATDEFVLGRSDERRRVKSTLRAAWDAGLEYAQARGWVRLSDDRVWIMPGDSEPA